MQSILSIICVSNLQGGLQQFLANVKILAPVFAKGCNLTNEFRHCLRPLIEKQLEQQCTVSSCLIQAGDGICNQPDTAKAIDDNLACVFKQVILLFNIILLFHSSFFFPF